MVTLALPVAPPPEAVTVMTPEKISPATPPRAHVLFNTIPNGRRPDVTTQDVGAGLNAGVGERSTFAPRIRLNGVA